MPYNHHTKLSLDYTRGRWMMRLITLACTYIGVGVNLTMDEGAGPHGLEFVNLLSFLFF
jgi:hypothetical protein